MTHRRLASPVLGSRLFPLKKVGNLVMVGPGRAGETRPGVEQRNGLVETAAPVHAGSADSSLCSAWEPGRHCITAWRVI